ncbi:unnamed protein product (macronuclear) [Paramecium tetraurelia]|uniref:Uncharacterized protein n=1 Tax=Paramecium tetraurelia TaxID=5888 RepID=A0DXY2_PARTE|nr:uncharacterized protein GSPATT00021523001 [Paramecium tetraurelia]CAK87899.1 unnamed protein product [Paramecium tetraurelia]|eukprot:XP_001455296.1 hypothetical protein (macronuclear) [Paramecium tetraurelia strain d4-2]
MALIHNQNDMQNMFSKAGKIASEKYIIFKEKKNLKNKPRYFNGKSQSVASSEYVNQQANKKNARNIKQKQQQKQITEAEKQLSRDQIIIYKKEQFATDYQPNFEFGKKQLLRSTIRQIKEEKGYNDQKTSLQLRNLF